MNLYELSLTDVAAALREQRFSAEEYAIDLAERCRAVDPMISAMAHWDAEALIEQAAEVDRRLSAGESPGALAGVPFGIKDIYDCAGMPTRFGVPGATRVLPTQSASSVQRLLDVGAIPFGKTATTERAYLDPGPTRNPWNQDHTPGGSSSGSAAGCAAEMFPVALGSQTAGSVIRPAAYCGVVGMTLTRGRMPMDGILPLAPSFDTVGFFVRSVDDAEFFYSVWTGDASEGESADEPRLLEPAYEGVLARVDAELSKQTRNAAVYLENNGMGVSQLELPPSFAIFESYQRIVFAYETSRIHETEFRAAPDRFSSNITELIEEGLELNEDLYRKALEELGRFRNEMLETIREVDALILPATTCGAPVGIHSTGDPACNAPWTAIGFPAITIPGGFTSEGLPLGIQFVGAPDSEKRLLSVARLAWDTFELGCPSPPRL